MRIGNRKRLVLFVGLLASAAVLAGLPSFMVSYSLVWVFLFAVYLTLAVSYDILGGNTGYMNLGHATFFGLGAYTAAILLNKGFSPATSLISGTIIPAGFAALVSYPLFRLKGAYFALGTFGMISLMGILSNNLTSLTGGSGGISTPSGNRMIEAYYLSLIVAAGTLVLSRFIARSRFGLALFSIREDEEVALAFGVSTSFYKCAAMVISSIPAGLIGGIYVWNVTYISPSSVFGLEIALSPIVMAMLGGTGTFVGPLVGVLFLTIVQELLWTKIPYLQLSMYGAIMVLVGLFMPGGMVRTAFINRLIRSLGLSQEANSTDLSVPKEGIES